MYTAVRKKNRRKRRGRMRWGKRRREEYGEEVAGIFSIKAWKSSTVLWYKGERERREMII